MSAFPDPGRERIATVADADAEGPHPEELVQLALSRGQPRGYAVRVVQDAYRHVKAMLLQVAREQLHDARTLQLRQVGRVLDHAILNQAGHGHADRGDVLVVSLRQPYLLADGLHQTLRMQLHQGRFVLFVERVREDVAHHLVVDDQPSNHSLRQHHAYGLCHHPPAFKLVSLPSAGIWLPGRRAYSNLLTRFNPLNAATL
jgi:hypothetical protein